MKYRGGINGENENCRRKLAWRNGNQSINIQRISKARLSVISVMSAESS
jgi:hypothetical protein